MAHRQGFYWLGALVQEPHVRGCDRKDPLGVENARMLAGFLYGPNAVVASITRNFSFQYSGSLGEIRHAARLGPLLFLAASSG